MHEKKLLHSSQKCFLWFCLLCWFYLRLKMKSALLNFQMHIVWLGIRTTLQSRSLEITRRVSLKLYIHSIVWLENCQPVPWMGTYSNRACAMQAGNALDFSCFASTQPRVLMKEKLHKPLAATPIQLSPGVTTESILNYLYGTHS